MKKTGIMGQCENCGRLFMSLDESRLCDFCHKEEK